MNDPKLPPNPWTISNTRKDPLDVSWLTLSHGILPETAIKQIDDQLQLLRDYDNYYRETSVEREYTKLQLLKKKKYFLKQVELEMEND